MQAIISENGALPRTQDTGMLGARPSVLVVDDDPEFRDSVARLLRSVDLETRHFSSVADFLKADLPDGPTCLVLDVRLPGQSGLELQRELAAADRQIPIIFITAHADVPMTVQAMKGGAIEFLTKPRSGAPGRRRRRPRARSCPPGEGQDIGCAQGALRDAKFPRTGDHVPGDGRPPQQTDCSRDRHRRIHGQGASHQLDAKDEGPFSA